MIDIIILLAINSFLCFGFWNACLYDEVDDVKGVLWKLEKWGQGKWYYKPIGGCLPCMASLHSIYPYWSYMFATESINIHSIMFYPVYIIALSGVNYLIDRE